MGGILNWTLNGIVRILRLKIHETMKIMTNLLNERISLLSIRTVMKLGSS